jgi:hypothetical protein
MAEARSVRALLSHLIDYAGLFPPAKLEMGPTVRNYASFLQSADEWMLGRLIVPVSRLDEFEREAEALLLTPAAALGAPETSHQPWLLSALTAPAGDAKLEADLARIGEFNARYAEGGQAMIDVIELKATSGEAIDEALEVIPDELFAFFEMPTEPDPRGLVTALTGSDAGAKIRTGGVTPDLYPTPEQLARFIRACAAGGIPFKATAGLHHPLRHRNEAVGADEFGFLNVFVGASLLIADYLTERELIDLLCETNAASFTIDDDGIRWRHRHVSTTDIEQVRDRVAIAFGSCSFDEPREDLRGLGLL